MMTIVPATDDYDDDDEEGDQRYTTQHTHRY